MNRLRLTYQLLKTIPVGKQLVSFVLLGWFLSLGATHAQCVLSCRDTINISINSTGYHIVDLGEILTGDISSCTDVIVKVFDESDTFIGDTITCDQLGQVVSAQALNTVTSTYCITYINVMDYQDPVISCSDIFVFCNDETAPNIVGYPAVSDNCTALDSTDLFYSDVNVDLDCFTVEGGETVTKKIVRTWTVLDESGNQDVCTQNIYLKRVTIGDVDFPNHHDGFALPTLTCSVDDPLDFDVAGQPLIFGKPIDNAGACEVVVTYTDQSFPTCGGGTRILRLWKVFDFCSITDQEQIQVIKVEDKIAPVINCPADISLGLDLYSCFNTVNLPVPTSTDECSDVTLSASWEHGSGFGPFPNILPGTYPITYSSTDECGNVSTCEVNLILEDDVPPQAICKNSLSLSLLNTGDARLYATNMDGGSSDNCQIVSTQSSRDNLSFGEYVEFTCADIENSPVLIYLKVTDAAGLSNICEIHISVYDYFKPQLVCPPDLTLNCQSDIYNLSLTSQAIATDNCGVDTIYYEDDISSITCGNELITRKWVAIDIHGIKDSCFQHIQLEDNANLIVGFPNDISIDICLLSSEPSNAGTPTLSGEGCKNVIVSHNDNFFFSSGACTVIQRTWEVIDWCVYVPNSGSNDGKYTGIQLITLEDNQAPIFSCLSDTVILDNANSCATLFVELPDITLTDCDSELTIFNNSPYAIESTNNASGNYPHGITVVTFTAVDGCGNESTCSFTINVKDNVSPTAQVKSSLAFHLNASGLLTITPDLIDNGSFDNCTASNQLIKEVIPNHFDCSSVGQQFVILKVTDEAGNLSLEQASITIIDDNICSGKIYGYVLTSDGEPVLKTNVVVEGGEYLYQIETDSLGYYEVEVPIGESYTITPEKNIFSLNGISTSDVVLMTKHVLGIKILTSPYFIVAGDVDKSGSIDVFDIVQLRRLLLRIDDVCPYSKSWEFIQSDYALASFQSSDYPSTYSISNFDGSAVTFDFKAIKMGDLNGNVNVNRSNRSLILSIENEPLERLKSYAVPIYAEKETQNDFEGFQFAFQIDEAYISDCEIVDLNGDILKQNYSYKNGILRMSWSGVEDIDFEQPLFYLKFDCHSDINLSDVLQIQDRYLQSESYFYDDGYLETGSLEIEWKALNDDVVNPNNSWMAYPNPVNSYTNISFDLNEAGSVKLLFYDVSGRLIFEINDQFGIGSNSININRASFNNAKGMVLCEIYINDMPIEHHIKLLLID